MAKRLLDGTPDRTDALGELVERYAADHPEIAGWAEALREAADARRAANAEPQPALPIVQYSSAT